MSGGALSPRARLLQGLFPDGVPRLWCPPLTHYDPRGAIDGARVAAHLRHLAPCVRGLLIPGSTGDGWELTRAERRRVLAIGLEAARESNYRVLIGALHPETSETLALIREDLDWLKSQCGEAEAPKALAKARVCGFTICPPRGQHLAQEEIRRALAWVLELGLPTAIYQLPQITLNEMGPEVVLELAQRYGNFIFFKDTSGLDAVALSGQGLGGVFAVRGAEGDYARWLKAAGGPYDGFLLASANCFARELDRLIADVSAGRWEAARRLSGRLTAAVGEVLRAAAAAVPEGNPFTNANKAMDHFFAHGPNAAAVPPPRLHAGGCLPLEFIRSTREILSCQGLLPTQGYLLAQ